MVVRVVVVGKKERKSGREEGVVNTDEISIYL